MSASEQALLDLVRPAVRAISAYKPVARTKGTILDANEHPYSLPEEARESLSRELTGVDIHRYPDTTVLQSFLAADHELPDASVVVGNGSDELISLLCATFANPRAGSSAQVLYPTPSFSVYPIAAKSAGVDLCEVPLGAGFELDLAAMHAAIVEHCPNLVFLARPNNPTGTYWTNDELLDLLTKHPSVLFVSDEAYGDYGAPSALGLLGEHKNLLVLRTLSKVGLAALRIGYLCGAAALCAEVNKVRGPYNIGTLNQVAAIHLMTSRRDWIRSCCERVVAGRDLLSERFAALPGIVVFPSLANFVLVRFENGSTDCERVYQQLRDKDIWTRRFSGDTRLGDCLRITVGTKEENQIVIAAMRAAISPA